MPEHWRVDLKLGLEDLVNKAVVAGARQEDVHATVLSELENLGRANERDPDPADEGDIASADEPPNDGPGAER